jgi:hypothetical protein
MTQKQDKELKYLIECVERNSAELANQKPSKSQIASFVKQKGWALITGDDSSQNIVDICSALLAYKVLQNK